MRPSGLPPQRIHQHRLVRDGSHRRRVAPVVCDRHVSRVTGLLALPALDSIVLIVPFWIVPQNPPRLQHFVVWLRLCGGPRQRQVRVSTISRITLFVRCSRVALLTESTLMHALIVSIAGLTSDLSLNKLTKSYAGSTVYSACSHSLCALEEL